MWLCRLSDRSVSHMGMGRLPRSFRAYNRIERHLQRRKHRRWLKRARARITATRRSLEANSLHDSIAQNAASNPLAPPPPAAPPAVCVRMIPRRGRALVAARCFRAGETILAEQPNVVVPMADDVGNALVCSRCLAFLGDTDMHLGLAAGRISIAAARAEIALGDSSQCFECGALYCGSECRVADVARGHRLLCPGGGGSSRGEADADGRAPDSKSMVAARMDDTRLNAAAAWERFRRHAREEAELPELELAATLLAAVLISETGMCTSETLEACVPLLLVQEPVATVLSRDAAGAEAAASTLREVETSCNLCRAAMILTCGAAGVAKASVRRRCTMTGTNSFGNLVGLAFLNQVAVTVSSPAEDVTKHLMVAASPAGGAEPAAMAALQQLIPLAQEAKAMRVGATEEEEVTIEDLQEPASLFPPLDATGLSYFVCLMNHSCAPNAVVSYKSEDSDARLALPEETRAPAIARIVALHDIAEGEEIVHPYVDRDEPLVQRHEGLAIYGIQCSCAKCRSGR